MKVSGGQDRLRGLCCHGDSTIGFKASLEMEHLLSTHTWETSGRVIGTLVPPAQYSPKLPGFWVLILSEGGIAWYLNHQFWNFPGSRKCWLSKGYHTHVYMGRSRDRYNEYSLFSVPERGPYYRGKANCMRFLTLYKSICATGIVAGTVISPPLTLQFLSEIG